MFILDQGAKVKYLYYNHVLKKYIMVIEKTFV